jgi:hypothetical protein
VGNKDLTVSLCVRHFLSFHFTLDPAISFVPEDSLWLRFSHLRPKWLEGWRVHVWQRKMEAPCLSLFHSVLFVVIGVEKIRIFWGCGIRRIQNLHSMLGWHASLSVPLGSLGSCHVLLILFS